MEGARRRGAFGIRWPDNGLASNQRSGTRQAKDSATGYFDIVASALKAPTTQIVDNGGEQGDVVVAQLLDKGKNIGYDANTGKFVDMFKAGIIDPAKVARTALEMAASVAGLMLTTNVLVTELKDKDEDEEPIPGSVR